MSCFPKCDLPQRVFGVFTHPLLWSFTFSLQIHVFAASFASHTTIFVCCRTPLRSLLLCLPFLVHEIMNCGWEGGCRAAPPQRRTKCRLSLYIFSFFSIFIFHIFHLISSCFFIFSFLFFSKFSFFSCFHFSVFSISSCFFIFSFFFFLIFFQIFAFFSFFHFSIF